ncbi:MAG: hypothetical protein FJW35_02050, partial [Acidobacteria bacterium]|nr:hypothetical protein [Acidobacteriota bacterium]
SNSPTVEFGIGKATKIDSLEIRWPSGLVQSFNDVPIDRRIALREGGSWKEVRGPRSPIR